MEVRENGLQREMERLKEEAERETSLLVEEKERDAERLQEVGHHQNTGAIFRMFPAA